MRTPVRRAAVGAVLAASALLCAGVQAAEPERPSYRLLWIRGDEASSCPGPSSLARGVVERLGYDPFRDDARASVEAHVDRSGGVWKATVRFSSGSSESVKRFESASSDCAAVAQAAELAIALAIGANEVAADDSPPPPITPDAGAHEQAVTAPSTSPPGPPDGARPRARPSPNRAPLPLEGLLAVSGMGTIGILPRPALGVDAHGLVRFRTGAFVSLGMAHVPEVSADDPGFQLGATLGRVGACFDPFGWTRSHLLGCAHGELGNTVVVVRELTPIAPGSRLFGAVSAGLLFVQPWRPFALLVEAEAMMPVPAYDFTLSGTRRTIYASPFVNAFLRVGLGFGAL